VTASKTTIQRFLAGIPVPVEPAAIERELAALWKPASEQAGAGASTAVTRVCLANLLVVGDAGHHAWQAGTLQKLSARFPCRILWVQLDSTGTDTALTADVTALCHLPSPGNPQVCSELITLHTSPRGAGGVPGAVRPLLEPDVPVVLWWAMPAGGAMQLFDALCALSDRVVVHGEPLASPALRTLCAVPSLHLCLRECAAGNATVLVWHTMSHWREMTAQFFDPPQLRSAWRGIEKVTVRYATPDGQPTAALPAALLAGWLAGQLRWTPASCQSMPGGARVRFAGAASRTVDVDLLAQAENKIAPGRLMSVEMTAAFESWQASFHLVRVVGERSEVRQAICLSESCTLLKSLPITERDEATLLGAAMESQSASCVFPRAAKTALWLLGGKN
jgi:glucose-6-phosphate dehydrogenase assembly protein OpcA